ncbi:MAG TPA: NAD-dependent epimerase/dehydratase family protein [Chitinophagaceae bacterium]|jgi:nucleoside-diphosphate-sugar epimerase|nr:NAD-dependent epimerase/dehydratase family protein [Chitinophagaceae bacterium]MBP9739203.1 NAD-dependent epimerase/dehydratase family protein [Chitinophagaceae bacterium]HPH22614.1 NAD-dependent epimerase/dehydratase family protein [Chitinophagaceae bacterium]
MKTVGIIGGSGFIGSYNTQKFLNEGYKLKVSTTDISKKEKYEHLLKFQHAENLEIVQMNVENKLDLINFLQGCSIVIHGGTPFQLDVKDPKTELFDPTIKGTENFLDAIQQTAGIEKVIFIASVAAYNTNFPLPPDDKAEEDSISETSEPFISEQSHPYAQAKFIANQTVNKFIADNHNLNYEIVSVSPVSVVGKSLSTRQDSTSSGLQFLFKNKIAPNPFVQMFYDKDPYFSVVDVADIAEAIFKAVQKKSNHGKNYLLASESYRVSDLVLMLNNQAPAGASKIIYNNNLAKTDLEINFKPATESLKSFSAE